MQSTYAYAMCKTKSLASGVYMLSPKFTRSNAACNVDFPWSLPARGLRGQADPINKTGPTPNFLRFVV